MVQQISTNTFGVAKWIVSSTLSNGTHTTIAAALTSASSGDTIFVRTGTYTENITLKAGVNITAFECDALTPNVTIVGTCTMTTAGTVTISGIRLQTNSSFLLAVTGSAASIVNLKDCYINCTNNTGISYTTSSVGAGIALYNCMGDLGTTGIAYLVSTASSGIAFIGCRFTNSGGSTTTSSTSTSTVSIVNCEFTNSITTSSTGTFTVLGSTINLDTLNSTALTLAGTGASFLFESFIGSGSSSAASIGAGTTLSMSNNTISSSNTNAVTGAGTVVYAGNSFSNTSSTINTTTQTARTFRTGRFQSNTQPAFFAYQSSAAANATGDGTAYTLGSTVDLTEIYDQGSNFDPATGTFTAPVTGVYQFCMVVDVTNTGAATQLTMSMVVAGTSAGTYVGPLMIPTGIAAAGTIILPFSTFLQMTATDTITFVITLSGTTKTVSVNGQAAGSGYITYVSGNLVC